MLTNASIEQTACNMDGYACDDLSRLIGVLYKFADTNKSTCFNVDPVRLPKQALPHSDAFTRTSFHLAIAVQLQGVRYSGSLLER